MMDAPRYPCPHCEGKGYIEGMTEREVLEAARRGQASYGFDRLMTKLGKEGMWEIVQTGTEPIIPGYWAQGGFWVDREPVWRSVLTETGMARLKQLRDEETERILAYSEEKG